MATRIEIVMYELARDLMLAADNIFQDAESAFNQGFATAYSEQQILALREVRKLVSKAMMRTRNDILGLSQ